LLARSATGQHLTAYTEFIAGPRALGQPDGADEVHLVFLDNGRAEILAGDCREILRCIRCGACLNVCPVYRQASGHAYRSTYPGPVGAVLTPLLAGRSFEEFSDLPFASTLCGACHEVCPVDIPIEELLVRLRDRASHSRSPVAAPASIQAWSLLASEPVAWRAALAAGRLSELLPAALKQRAAGAWGEHHEAPAWRGGAFRRWLERRSEGGS
jgi:L-lactate dehydrogenase complex protein LldF